LNSTGYATADFAQWDTDAQILLMFAMFIGGSAGSTGGGVKIVRWLIVTKPIRRELFTTAHPDVVQPVRLSGTVVDEDAIRGVMAFTVLYLVLFGVSAVFISLDTARIGIQLTTLESTSASLATIEYRTGVRSAWAVRELSLFPRHVEAANGVPNVDRPAGDRPGARAVHLGGRRSVTGARR